MVFMSACDDEDKTYLEYKKDIKVINKSERDIWMQYFKNSKIFTEHELRKDAVFEFGLIKDSINNSHIHLNCDSVWLVFDDNKKLVYRRDNCSIKNIICENTYSCGAGKEPYWSYCTYTITPEDYKNAK